MHGVGPEARAGQTVGLLGGSFDPPHLGHVALTLAALRRFGLDRVWWLASPGNPLKERGPAPMALRLVAARALVHDPRVEVTDLEARLGTRYTAGTLRFLRTRHPGVRFVWLMGADNLAQFHRWSGWRRIAEMLPIAVIDRPWSASRALSSPAALALGRFRRPERDAAALARKRPPAWTFIHGKRSALSSTALRDRGQTVS
jgi:nicotinate-nucleotide adenylyltransferase